MFQVCMGVIYFSKKNLNFIYSIYFHSLSGTCVVKPFSYIGLLLLTTVCYTLPNVGYTKLSIQVEGKIWNFILD